MHSYPLGDLAPRSPRFLSCLFSLAGMWVSLMNEKTLISINAGGLSLVTLLFCQLVIKSITYLFPLPVPTSQEIYCHKLGTVHVSHLQTHPSSQWAFSFQATHTEQPAVPQNNCRRPPAPGCSCGCRVRFPLVFNLASLSFPKAQVHVEPCRLPQRFR